MIINKYLTLKYIKTRKKTRKIMTYKSGENDLRIKHEKIAAFLNKKCMMSLFAKAYIKKRSIIKNAQAHMYNDIFLMYDVKNFFSNINHNKLIKSLYFELNKNVEISKIECAEIVKYCSINKKGLPLGLVTSPVLSNIYMKEFDNILYGKLRQLCMLNQLTISNIIYTRYADDMVISFKMNNSTEDFPISIINRIIDILDEQLARKHLKRNKAKDKKFNILHSKHVKITGINIIRDGNNQRILSAGRKIKNDLYYKALNYIEKKDCSESNLLKIKGLESFILSVEGVHYEKCYSSNMLDVVKKSGYTSLHHLIKNLE